jgi:hypothetical protein
LLLAIVFDARELREDLMSYAHRIVALVSGILLCPASMYIISAGLIEFPWDYCCPNYYTNDYRITQPITAVALAIVSFAWSWLGLCAERSWRRLRGCKWLVKVIEGVKFRDGMKVQKVVAINRRSQPSRIAD